MVPFTSSRVVVVAGFLGVLLCPATAQTPAQVASLPVASQTTSSEKRWVTFDFSSPDGSGDLQVGKPLELSIALSGMAQGHAPLVAICESIHFQQQIVTLEPDPISMVLKAIAPLAPILQGKLSVSSKFARVRVTFAQESDQNSGTPSPGNNRDHMRQIRWR